LNHRGMAVNQKDTLPKLLKGHYEIWGERRVALRDKKSGIWQEYSWKDYYENVKRFALGLKSLGFQPGEKICIIGDNEPEWYCGELACQSVRGVAVGIFADCSPEEIKYIVEHSEAVFILARDQEQTDKILQIRKELRRVRKTIYWAPAGMWSYDDPFIMSFEQVQKLGEEYEKKNPMFFEEEVERGKEEDLATLSYTAGATGPPKGCMVTHKNLIFPVREWLKINRWNESDNYFSYFSSAWILEQFFGLTAGLVSGAAVNFPEGPETGQSDIREIGPSVVLYNFRLWESLCFTIQNKIEGGSPIKRALFKTCLSQGYQLVDEMQKGKSPSVIQRFFCWLANYLVFRPLKDKIGLLFIRHPYSGGASLSPSAFRFLQAVGIPLKQIYASSEAGLFCGHPAAKNLECNSLGFPLSGVEIKISEEGEMLCKGSGIFRGYYKDPEKTVRVFIDGWYHSGDAARIDEEGQIIYLDRMADMMELDGKEKYPAQTVESTLRFSPYIKEVMALAGGRPPWVAALVQIDFNSVGKWAESQRIAYTTFADLSQKPQVYDLVEKEIKTLNLRLPEAARVKKFVCLSKELDPDDGELTRDRKLRKNFLRHRYHELLEAVFEGKETFPIRSASKPSDEGMREASNLVIIRTLA